LEGVLRQDSLLHVGDEEIALGIIPAVSECHLGQIIGSKGEELRQFGDLGGSDRRAWNLDHGSELVGEPYFLFSHHGGCNALQAGLNPFQLLDGPGEWNHNLRVHNDLAQGAIRRGFKDGAHLHFHDLGHDDAQADAAQTHHRVRFAHGTDRVQQFFTGR
jgi:hypothetical protein